MPDKDGETRTVAGTSCCSPEVDGGRLACQGKVLDVVQASKGSPASLSACVFARRATPSQDAVAGFVLAQSRERSLVPEVGVDRAEKQRPVVVAEMVGRVVDGLQPPAGSGTSSCARHTSNPGVECRRWDSKPYALTDRGFSVLYLQSYRQHFPTTDNSPQHLNHDTDEALKHSRLLVLVVGIRPTLGASVP